MFDDCLKYFRDWQICASIDATGEIGEYIRTGLNYNKWLENIKYGKKFMKNPRQLELDLTVTMPGLFDLENMYKLSKDLKLVLLCKKVFSFGPNNLWSPLCLPRDILHEIVDNVIEKTSEKKNVFNLAFYAVLFALIMEFFPLRSQGSFFSVWNASYVFFVLGILSGLNDLKTKKFLKKRFNF